MKQPDDCYTLDLIEDKGWYPWVWQGMPRRRHLSLSGNWSHRMERGRMILFCDRDHHRAAPVPTKRSRGRPRKANALTPAQRAQRYRDNKRTSNAKLSSVTQILDEDKNWVHNADEDTWSYCGPRQS